MAGLGSALSAAMAGLVSALSAAMAGLVSALSAAMAGLVSALSAAMAGLGSALSAAMAGLASALTEQLPLHDRYLYRAGTATILLVLFLLVHAVIEEFSFGWIAVRLSEPVVIVDAVLDGKPLPARALNEPLRLSTGEHHLLVGGSSHQPWSRTFSVRRGINPTLEVILAPPQFHTTRVGQKLKRIPAGELLMGSPYGEGVNDEHPQHRVRIPRPFYLGETEVTQAQYQAVMGVNPSYFSSNGAGKDRVAGQSTDRHPVESVSWLDAARFCNKLSELEELEPFYEIDGDDLRVPDESGPGYRLPTEAEWEYACRGGTTTKYSFGDNEANSGEYGWFDENSGGRTHPVGEKRPNPFGLFDMHGNVSEWCWDGYADDYYQRSPVDDPRGADGASERVIRGGGWNPWPRFARSAHRYEWPPKLWSCHLGFRLAQGPGEIKSVAVTGVSDRRSIPSNPRSLTDSIGVKLVLIPAGEFLMGSPDGDGASDEYPQHRVRITRPFYLSATEVTRGQFRRFVYATGYRTEAEQDGKATWRNRRFEQTDENPVVAVSWNDAMEYCRWLSRREGATYRLPTEAEWEYACRGGATTRYSFGDDAANLGEYGWLRGNSGGRTHPVGGKQPNSFGLFDMYGNVWEWCRDGYADDYYQRSPVDDPQGADGAPGRVIRGGGRDCEPRDARSASRNCNAPEKQFNDLGFRVARVQSAR
jgi:formylglycine-generating enzyme required for sulfatase activity